MMARDSVYSAPGRGPVDVSSSTACFLAVPLGRPLAAPTARPAEERRAARRCRCVQWLSGRPFVSVFRPPGGSLLEEPSFASPLDPGRRRAVVEANLYRTLYEFSKMGTAVHLFSNSLGRPSGERRPLNTDILLYANSIMYVILL